MRQQTGSGLPYRLTFLVARWLAIGEPDGAGGIAAEQDGQAHGIPGEQGENAHEPSIQAPMHRHNPRRPAMSGLGRQRDRPTTLCSTRRSAKQLNRSPAR
jgi:hypothetical protein